MGPQENSLEDGVTSQGYSPAAWHLLYPWCVMSSSGRFSGVPEEIITNSAEETIQWGKEFSKRLKAPVVGLLTGDLGTGRTTPTKGIVSGLRHATEDDATIPTFTLLHLHGNSPKVYYPYPFTL